MPKTRVRKSVHIASPIEEVFQQISDFKNWPAWSPWLVCEPDAKLTYPDNGQSYSWEGKIIGAGSVQKLSENAPERLVCELQILKPWKAVSEVIFELKEKDGGTEITWILNGKLPLVMFWMKPMMETLIGMDYNRGLTMLKDLCETGSVPNKIEQAGVTEFKGSTFVGTTTDCKIDDIGPGMDEDFGILIPWVNEHGMDSTKQPFCMYEKWDMNKQDVRYTLGFPVKTVPDTLPEKMISGEIPSGKVYAVRHVGPYRHLGNAWALGMLLSRNKVFRQRKGAYPFELYINDPRETDEKDLEVHICFPVI